MNNYTNITPSHDYLTLWCIPSDIDLSQEQVDKVWDGIEHVALNLSDEDCDRLFYKALVLAESRLKDILVPEEFDDGQDDKGPHPIQNSMDEDNFNMLVELQARMKRGMEEFIQPKQEAKDWAYVLYADAKRAFQAAKDCLNNWNENNGPFPWWKQFNERKATRDQSFREFKAHQATLATYWDNWKALNAQAQELTKDDKALWGKFFGLFQEPIKYTKESITEAGIMYRMVSSLDIRDEDGKLVGNEPALALNMGDMMDYLNQPMDLTWVGFDPADIDEQQALFMQSNEQMEEYLISHIKEEAEYNKDEDNTNPGSFWDWKRAKAIYPCKRVNPALQQALDEIDTMISDSWNKDMDRNMHPMDMTPEEAAPLEASCPF